MGGAVSSGRDNNELIDNLMSGNYIRTKEVESVLRALDRAEYMTPEARDQAYKDLAWRNGPLHLSSPCIYSEVMEGLELKPGLSFLNIGSGTGYLSTLAGLILGTSGISHGVELHPAVFEYAVKKLGQFMENSPILDDFDFCEPKFYLGNGLCLSPLSSCYDRVYCGAACTEEYENYFKRLIKVGGILVMPLNDTLQHVRRVGESKWVTRNILNVSFATLRAPSRDDAAQPLTLEKQTPVRLQLLSRAVVRAAMRRGVLWRHPELREAPRAPPPAACPRRICIPIEPGGAVEGLNVLHDLDSENGANEMNALLSLVISMGHNRVAGALRFDRVDDSPSDSDSDDDDTDNENDNDNDREPRANRQGSHSRDTALDDDSRGNRSETDSRDNREERDSRGDRSETESRGDRSETVSRDERSENDSRDDRLDSSRDEDRHDGVTRDDRPERDLNKQPEKASRDDKQGTDLRDDRRPMPRRDSKDKGDSRQNKRHRRPRDDEPKFFPPACREFLSYSFEEPSTSTKGSQTVVSGEVIAGSEQRSASTDDNGNSSEEIKGADPPGVPSEVEIDLGKKIAQEASTSLMDWDDIQSDTLEVSEDDTENTKSKAKRQKLDSGIGETTPSSSSSDKSKTESDSEQSYSTTDDAASLHSGARSEEDCVELSAHAARRRRRVARGGDARRVRLSLLMKQAVRELPLPHALKKFVNLGRCFEF